MQDYIPDQSIYKCMHELECETLDKIREEVMNWVVQNTNFLNEKTVKNFWHQIDYKNMGRVCPSLIKYMASIKLPIGQIAVGLLSESRATTGVILHNDAPPHNFKINFPIYNTEDIWTEWYDIPKDVMYKLDTIINPFTGTEEYDFNKIHCDVQYAYPCLMRYNIHHKPIIFNSYVPHRVVPGPAAKYPRIMVATMPLVDPSKFMLQ